MKPGLKGARYDIRYSKSRISYKGACTSHMVCIYDQ